MIRTGQPQFSSSVPAIQQRVAYFDTVKVLIPRHLNKDEQARLKDLDPSMHYELKIREGKPGFLCSHAGEAHLFVAGLTFQYLTVELTRAIEEIFENGPPPLVNAAHIALDLIVGTRDDAEALQEYLELRYLKRGHSKGHRIIRCQTTRYYGRRRQRNVVAIYSDRPCRIEGNPCCHIERRLQGRGALREQGITTLRDLLNFEPRSFWSRGLHLCELRPDAIQKIGELLYRHGPKRQIFRDREAAKLRWRVNAGVFLRGIAAQEGSYPYPTATGLDAALKQFGLPSLRRFSTPVDVSGLLPSGLSFKRVPDQ